MTRTRAFPMLLVAFLVAALASTAASAQEDLDCADFEDQAAAQAEYDADTSDPNNLDADDDGIPCEAFFADDGDGAMDGDDGDDADDGEGALDGSDDTVMPTGGVATGGGGTADTSSPLAGAVALLAALAAFVVAGRAAVSQR